MRGLERRSKLWQHYSQNYLAFCAKVSITHHEREKTSINKNNPAQHQPPAACANQMQPLTAARYDIPLQQVYTSSCQ